MRKELIISKMAKTLYIFTGAGNNFMVLDGRKADMTPFRQPSRITELCRRHHTDGLMILTLADAIGPSRPVIPGPDRESPYDFVMEFYNPDGSGGMMCGNGGRCIVAFADYLGLKPASEDGTWHFLAPDGPHEAQILSAHALSAGKVQPTKTDLHQISATPSPNNAAAIPNCEWTVRLKMIDVSGINAVKNGYFLNTGTRHYVEFRNNVDAIDMDNEAKPIRWADEFQPEGVNVNFVEATKDGLKVRTFEKGVEGETLACGTGITASAMAAYHHGIPRQESHVQVGDDVKYRLQCRRGDWLEVEFTPIGNNAFRDVFLTGPAELTSISQ